jgi:enamine deaminase RidA (YjgF/YER057c/UK114 family)
MSLRWSTGPSRRPTDKEDDMQRTPINPWPWSSKLGFDQAELVEGATRQLVCSGQDAVDADGAPQHPGDMAAQLALALDNLEAVLADAGMALESVVRLNVYTTDVDELFKHWHTLTARLDAGFATSVLGVTRLAAPQLLVLLEATAAD